jgi:hypothetical protein
MHPVLDYTSNDKMVRVIGDQKSLDKLHLLQVLERIPSPHKSVIQTCAMLYASARFGIDPQLIHFER